MKTTLETLTRTFNEMRMSHLNQPFKRQDIRMKLYSIGFPKSDYVLKSLVDNNIILRHCNNHLNVDYYFTKEPVHIERIKEAIHDYKQIQNEVFKRNYYKNKQSKVETSYKEFNEEYAINFLKSKGYKVLKPQWEEV